MLTNANLFPVSISLCLLINHNGNFASIGFKINFSIAWTFASVRLPMLEFVLIFKVDVIAVAKIISYAFDLS